MCIDILWLCIGSEFSVLALNLSLGRQKTECLSDQDGSVSVFTDCGIRGFYFFVTTRFNTAALTIHDLFQ